MVGGFGVSSTTALQTNLHTLSAAEGFFSLFQNLIHNESHCVADCKPQELHPSGRQAKVIASPPKGTGQLIRIIDW